MKRISGKDIIRQSRLMIAYGMFAILILGLALFSWAMVGPMGVLVVVGSLILFAWITIAVNLLFDAMEEVDD